MSNTANEMRVFDKLDKDDNDYINNVIKKRPKNGIKGRKKDKVKIKNTIIIMIGVGILFGFLYKYVSLILEKRYLINDNEMLSVEIQKKNMDINQLNEQVKQYSKENQDLEIKTQTLLGRIQKNVVGRLYDKEKQKFLPNLKKKLQMRNINMFYSPTHYDPLLRSHSTKNFSRTASCGFFSPNRIGSPIIPSVKLNLRVVKKKRINK